MPTESNLDSVQTSTAKHLRTIRPAVIPGTNAIIDDGERKAWHAIVSFVAGALDLTQRRAQAEEFFDICGVAN